MTPKHPITPPPELFAQWLADAMKVVGRKIPEEDGGTTGLIAAELAIQAARWGADQELEACVQWISEQDWTWTSAQLRRARRPMPPSLKEQALEALNRQERGRDRGSLRPQSMADADIIRRALETLPND
jgi:hypothetical protein